MGNIGDPITPSIPAVGSSGPGYATDIDAILTEVVARLSAKIPLSSLLFSTTLDLNAQAITNVAYLTLEDSAVTPPASSPVNRITQDGGDFYWVGPSGPVKITNGATLNMASVSGINGDYGGVNPASVYYDAGTSRYNFYSNYSTLSWGEVKGLTLDIAGGATSTFMAKLAYGGVANYTLTLPAALPGAQTLLQVTAAGQMLASSTLDTNQSITLAGTGNYKHGSKQITCSWASKFATVGAFDAAGGSVAAGVAYVLGAAGDTAYADLTGLKIGDRILSIAWGSITPGTNPTVTCSIDGSARAGTLAVTGGGTITTFTLTTPYVLTNAIGLGSPVTMKLVCGSLSTTCYAPAITFDRI